MSIHSQAVASVYLSSQAIGNGTLWDGTLIEANFFFGHLCKENIWENMKKQIARECELSEAGSFLGTSAFLKVPKYCTNELALLRKIKNKTYIYGVLLLYFTTNTSEVHCKQWPLRLNNFLPRIVALLKLQ